MSKSSIEWTDYTWNAISGCTKISPGCAHCYAERMSKRLAGRFGYPKDDPFAVTLHPERLTEPLHWKKPRQIFPCSMSDIFHPEIPDRYRAAIFGIMAATPRHTYMVLTKRPEAAREWFESIERRADEFISVFPYQDAAWRRRHVLIAAAFAELGVGDLPGISDPAPWPLPNVWIGVTAEDQKRADERIPVLLQIPAALRFVSCGPLLGPVNIRGYLMQGKDPGKCSCGHGHGFNRCPNYGGVSKTCWVPGCECKGLERQGSPISLVIAEGESGPGARVTHPDCFRGLRDQCQAAGVKFFFKGWGDWLPAVIGYDAEGQRACGVMPDGSLRDWMDCTEGNEMMYRFRHDSHWWRSGRRELDGRTWDELPEVRA